MTFKGHFQLNKTTAGMGNPNDPPYRERWKEKTPYAAAWVI